MPLTPRTLLFWSAAACCLVAQVLIVRSVLAVRPLPDANPDLPRSRGAMELVWALVPAVALAVLLLFTWRAIRQRESLDVPGAAPTLDALR